MLSKKQLEDILAAWPDETGYSSNPALFEKWMMMQNQYFVDKVYLALGNDRINALSNKQVDFLNVCLERLKNEKCVFDITFDEIEGQYELVTEHFAPTSFENALKLYRRKSDYH